MERRAYTFVIVGGIVGVLNAPMAGLASAAAYAELSGGATPSPPALLAPLLSFAAPNTVYGVYGAVWIPVAALLLAAALDLRAHRRGQLSRSGRAGLDLMIGGLALTIPGNVGDYVLGRLDTPWAFGASAIGFALTMIGTLAYVAGAVLAGTALLRAKAGARAAAWAIAAAPLAFPAILLVRNAPAGPFLVICASWLVASALWRREGAR